MSEPTPSVSRTLIWLLLLMLIGVVALYSWYNDKQKEALTGKDTELAQAAQRLSEADTKYAGSLETQEGLRTEMDALIGQHQSQAQNLKGEIDATNQTNQGLLADMEALRTQHAASLAAEQEKASQAYVELEERNSAANQQIAALGTEIDQLKQASSEAAMAHQAQMGEAAAAHQTQVQQIDQELNARIDLFRIALEGSDPERAAQLGGLEKQVETNRQALDEAQQALQANEAAKAELTESLAHNVEVIEQQEQALAAARDKLDGLQAALIQERSALAALQSKHDATLSESAGEVASLQQQLQATEAVQAQAKADADASMRAAQDAHASQMAEAEGRISTLSKELQAEQAALVALQQKYDSTVTELRGTLADREQSLGSTKEELSASRQAVTAHAKEVDEARTTVAGLEETLRNERSQAEQNLATVRQEGAATVSYTRGLYKHFSDLGGRSTDQGMLLSLADADLRFRISKADLPDGELPSLDRIASLLVEHPNLTVRIEGHTDDAGSDETNLELSQKRADAVKQALADRGVGPERVAAEGIGEARPIADNKTSAGRRQNRRVEVYVIEN